MPPEGSQGDGVDFPRGISGFPPLRMEDCRRWEGGVEELRRRPEGQGHFTCWHLLRQAKHSLLSQVPV